MRAAFTVAAFAAATVLPTAQHDTNRSLSLAAHAWDRGDYPGALRTYLQILDSAVAELVLEPIALQTGELYQTIELTPDGAAPQFSPDGAYVTYETGPAAERVTRLVSIAEPTTVLATLPGRGAAFAPDGRAVAYIATVPGPQQPGTASAASPAPSKIVLRDIASRRDTELDLPDIDKTGVALAAGGTVVFTGSRPDGPAQIYSVVEGRAIPITSGDGDKVITAVNRTGTALLFSIRSRTGRGGGRGGAAPGGQGTFGVLSLSDGRVTTVAGSAPSFSPDGSTIAYVARDGTEHRLVTAPSADPASASIVRRGPERIDAPAASAGASRFAFQMMVRDDWELFLVNRDGTDETRVTREIQHDLLPHFLTRDRLLAVMGEPRHRRSYLYDLSAGTRTRLFHNNTIRTIAPEYSWAASPDGTRILIAAERDGDTVSPQRGVYLLDLTRKVTRAELRARVAANLAAEQALRAKAARIYAPIADRVRTVVADASVSLVYGYEKALFDFDSKHITRPGNRRASAYLHDTYRSFGYQPEYQWFEPRAALDGRTANVIATLTGTINPELVYVVSSHYDSVAGGPGADDDSSGTAALLEAARLLARHPQPATIVFASFTGEESGLLGSREFVRRAVADKIRIVGALNNDMIGWANDHRLDNTIRYSNAGIRDVQHAAAMQFTNLITYDALYYKGTDAAAYYEAWGDIVGGIGSYPVLGNPHYHQPHDLLDTINHQLVTEVAKTTAATLMLLASSPSRLTGLQVDSYSNGTARLSWKPGLEKGITGYIVAWGPAADAEARQVRVTAPRATLTGVAPGTAVSVKAINDKGLEGWDWARTVVK